MSPYGIFSFRASDIRPKVDEKSIERCLRRAFSCEGETMDVNGRWLDGVIKEVEEGITKAPLVDFAVSAQRLKSFYYGHDDWVAIRPSEMISLLNMVILHRAAHNIVVKGFDIEKLRSLTKAPGFNAICKAQVYLDSIMKEKINSLKADNQAEHSLNWDELREEILSMRETCQFSSMVAVMPKCDPPRMVTAYTEGIYPVRDGIDIKKLR